MPTSSLSTAVSLAVGAAAGLAPALSAALGSSAAAGVAQRTLAGLSLTEWIAPVALAVGGILLGVLSESSLMRRLRGFADETGWVWDNAVIEALRGMTFIWFAAAGLYAASLTVSLPPEVQGIVERTLVVAVIFTVTVVAARAAAAGVRAWASRAGGVPSTTLLQNVARILVFVLGVFLIVENLGFDVTALLTGLGIGGLAVALALQDTLSNLFAGFQIILARQVRSGDYIRLDTGEEGFVTDIKWRNTTIKSRVEDHEVVIPNAKLSNTIVTNFDLPAKPFWVRLDVGVSYASDLERVEEVTLEVAREVMEEFGLATRKEDPVLRYKSFGDSAVQFSVRLRVDDYSQQFQVRHVFVKRLHARYREEGIEIPFPIRTVYAPKGVEVRGEGASSRPAGGAGTG